VRSHAKAPSSGSTSGRGKSLGSSIRRAFVIRGAFLASSGSGALSRRAPLALLSVAAAILALGTAAVTPAFAAKEVINHFGSKDQGEKGGEFRFPAGVAVNSAGNGPADPGDIYVADTNNHRIQRFDSKGAFVSAWGRDVIAPTINEVQRIRIDAADGTFTLTFGGSTTSPIAYDARNFTIDDALDVLPSIGGDANVEVRNAQVIENNREFIVTFQGVLTATDQPQMTADTSQLAGTLNVSTIANGTATTSDTGTGFEVCTIAVECKQGMPSGGNGTVSGNGAMNRPYAVAVDDDTGKVYVSDPVNNRIDVYDGAGAFVSSFGFDVNATEAATGYEICPPTDVCKEGVPGSGVGQIGPSGSFGNELGLAVSPPDGNVSNGTLFLADLENQRVNTYNLDGTAPSSFGSASNFGTEQPRQVAVDSRGIIYASDSQRGGEIERYDSEGANGGGVVFLPPIRASVNERQTVTFTGFSSGADRYSLSCPNGGETGPGREWVSTGEGPQRMVEQLRKGCGAGAGDFKIVSASFNSTQITVQFRGSFAALDVPQMTCTKVTTPEFGACSVTTVEDGSVGALLNAADFPQFATSGFAVHPDSDGGGPDTDILYVGRRPQPGNDVVQQFGPANKPGLATAPTVTDDTHGTGAEFGPLSAIALNDASGELLASSSQHSGGQQRGHQIYVLNDPVAAPKPVLSVNEVNGVTDTTAIFSGIVDPKGGPVSCRYQYSTDQLNWTDVPEAECGFLESNGGPQAVTQHVAGLDPASHYYVRLVALRPFISNSTTIGPGLRAFDTKAVPPVITEVGAVQVSDISARLVGVIDPRNSATGYVFEYGQTPAFGSTTPPIDIGGGVKPMTISQVVSGLAPDTTYYFRLRATNQTATTTDSTHTFHTRPIPFPPASPGNCPNQGLRQEQGSDFLPDCRAYEMVSPPDKNLNSVIGGLAGRTVGVSLDGDSVGFCPGATFGEPAGQMGLLCAPYLSRRSSGGWTTSDPFPLFCRNNIDGVAESPGTIFALLSPDFSRAAVSKPEQPSCGIPSLDPAAPALAANLYREDFTTDPFEFELLAPRKAWSEEPFEFNTEALGGSDDFSHIVYISRYNQTDPPDSPPSGVFHKLYEWRELGERGCAEAGGCLTLVSKAPSGEPFITPSSYPSTRGINQANEAGPNRAVSSDGERIYFQNPTESSNFRQSGCTTSCELYMREGGTTTHEVSASECTSSCGSGSSADLFRDATPAGDKAIFISCAKLTDVSAPHVVCGSDTGAALGAAPGSKLYRWDRDGTSGHHLVDLSVDSEPIDGAQPNAVGLIGSSTDMETVFFVADGQLVAGEPAAPNRPKIYRWRWNAGAPILDYLGALPAVSGGSSEVRAWLLEEDAVTSNGKYLLITTAARLNPAEDRDFDTDVFRWDEMGGWRCVSCQGPGAPSAGNSAPGDGVVGLSYNFGLRRELGGGAREHAMTDDGRVFFETPDALVQADINGDAGCEEEKNSGGSLYPCEDVYEWNDGTVSLITTGNGGEVVHFIGTTPSGNAAFFYTASRLVGWDTDNSFDIYAARTDGGFPEPPPRPAACEGESCRAAATGPSGGPGAGSAVFEAPAEQKPQKSRRSCPRGKRKVVRKGNTRCVKRNRRTANSNRRAAR
jgi:NHL repeat-containing protein